MSHHPYGSDPSQHTQPMPPPSGSPYQPLSQPDPVDLLATPRKSRKTLIVASSVGVLTFFVGIGVGGSSKAPATAAAPTATVTVPGPAPDAVEVPGPTVTETVTVPGPVVTVTAPAPKPAAPKPAPGLPTTIEQGQWEVGVDIAPGRYKTTATVDPDGMCYWKITKTGNPDNIVDNDIVSGGKPTVTIKKGQDFTTEDCGTWAKVG